MPDWCYISYKELRLGSASMLDAFIIDRIRREQAQRDSGLHPLHIQTPDHDEQRRRWEDSQRRQHPADDDRKHGVVIIDFNI